VDDDGVLTSDITLNDAQQGPPHYAHGSASAAILDEAMGLVVWAARLKVAAVNLEINYQKPLRLHQPLRVEARVAQKDGRRIFSSGEIKLANGITAISGRGIYVVAPQLFENVERKKRIK
jgi:acyl-coenzyme A thioesterase PaaI-like protein